MNLMAIALLLVGAPNSHAWKDPQTCTFPPGSNVTTQQLEDTPGKCFHPMLVCVIRALRSSGCLPACETAVSKSDVVTSCFHERVQCPNGIPFPRVYSLHRLGIIPSVSS